MERVLTGVGLFVLRDPPAHARRLLRVWSEGVVVDEFARGLGGEFAEGGEDMAFEGVIGDEEVLDLPEDARIEVAQGFDGVLVFIGFGDGDEAVVAGGLAFVFLFLAGLDGADEAGGDEASAKGRLIHKEEDVEGVAIVAFGGGNEAEVEGEDCAVGQDFFECEAAGFGGPGVFVAGAFGGFDEDVEVARVGVEGGEGEKTFHFSAPHDLPQS